MGIRTFQDRHRGNKKCKNCRSFAVNRPELVKYWHPTKNENIAPEDVTYGSNRKVWWICEKGHEYKVSIHSKSKGSGCPYCNGNKLHKENCLAVINPELSKEWHPILNGNKTPENVFSSSRKKKAWWECQNNKEHVWESSISARHQEKQGCPYCSGKKVSNENSLAVCFPILSNQWHSSKNGDLTPNNVTKSSGKRVWWQCNNCDYEWKAAINNRVRSSGKCPKCKKK